MPEYWNNGFATEAGRASIDFGFNTLNLDVIYGITEQSNIASAKALLKISFTIIAVIVYEPKTRPTNKSFTFLLDYS